MRERILARRSPGATTALLLKRLVERGLRAQVRTGNLLTGRLYVALEFVPKPPRAAFDASAAVLTLPTVPGALADVQPQLAEIVARLVARALRRDRHRPAGHAASAGAARPRRLAADHAGQRRHRRSSSSRPRRRPRSPTCAEALAQANQTLASAQATLRSAETQPHRCAGAAATQRRNQALAELQRAAQALRVLADYLQRHPESMLRGKPEMPLPPAGDKR